MEARMIFHPLRECHQGLVGRLEERRLVEITGVVEAVRLRHIDDVDRGEACVDLLEHEHGQLSFLRLAAAASRRRRPIGDSPRARISTWISVAGLKAASEMRTHSTPCGSVKT